MVKNGRFSEGGNIDFSVVFVEGVGGVLSQNINCNPILQKANDVIYGSVSDVTLYVDSENEGLHSHGKYSAVSWSIYQDIYVYIY